MDSEVKYVERAAGNDVSPGCRKLHAIYFLGGIYQHRMVTCSSRAVYILPQYQDCPIMPPYTACIARYK